MSEPSPRLGVVLANLGTPDAPTPSAVRRYLREFLSDGRVIEVPKPVWWLVLNLFILPFRPRRVARLYGTIWQDGDSPMRTILRSQCARLAEQLQHALPQADVHVLPAMSYGQPSIAGALDALQERGVERIVVLPLFPQYSATSTAPVYDAVARWLGGKRDLPAITFIMQSIETLICYGKRIFGARAGIAIHDRGPSLRPTEFGLRLVERYARELGPYRK